MEKIVPASYQSDGYTCPFCETFAHQRWFPEVVGQGGQWGTIIFPGISLAQCSRCQKVTLWVDGTLVHPQSEPAPMPNNDLPSDISADYMEARAIVAKSPRGAAALLRLCIQKLCVVLGQPGKDLNTDIGTLVKKRGLLPQVQQALDAVRVVGNNAVHPGEMDVKDTPEVAFALFGLVNLITEQLISYPKQAKAVYEQLPEGPRDAIERRDAEPS